MGDVDLTKWIPQSTAKSLTGNNAPLEGPAPYYYNYSFGDIFSGNMSSAKAAAQQNVADYYEWVRNEASAERQREYELWLDNTRVQRTMQDLQAAGLNPWLAVQSAGFGGSVPSGAAASSSAGQVSQHMNSPGATIGATAVGIAALVKLVAKFLK